MKFIIYILVLLASVAIGVWLRGDTGFIHIEYKDWILEAPVWLGIILLALLVFAILILFDVTSAIINLPTLLKNYFYNLQNDYFIRNSQQALICLLTGDFKAAYKCAIKAKATSNDFVTAHLIAANAASKLGLVQESNKHIREIKVRTPILKEDLDIFTAKLEFDAHNIPAAQKLLENLKQKNISSYALYNILTNVYKANKKWLLLKELLPLLKKKDILTELDYLLTTKLVYLELLKSYIQDKNQELTEQLWQDMPKNAKQDAEIFYHYMKYLISINQDSLADKELRNYLKKQLDNNLVTLLATINDNKYAPRITFLENLLKDNPSNPYILFALGKICCKAKLFGVAKDYLLASLGLKRTKECYLELARLSNMLNEAENAAKYYKEGFLLTTQDVA